MGKEKSPYNVVSGTAHIVIRFENRVQWQKYRKYILKTEWEFDGGNGPYTAYLDERFECCDDIDRITKIIVNLLQLGFDVYSCNWELDQPRKQEVLIDNGDGTWHREYIEFDDSEPVDPLIKTILAEDPNKDEE